VFVEEEEELLFECLWRGRRVFVILEVLKVR
jgi:hypothetical protein